MENLRALRDMTMPHFLSMPLEGIKEMLSKFVQQRRVFANIPLKQELGIMRVDSVVVKASLSSSPDQYVTAAVLRNRHSC